MCHGPYRNSKYVIQAVNMQRLVECPAPPSSGSLPIIFTACLASGPNTSSTRGRSPLSCADSRKVTALQRSSQAGRQYQLVNEKNDHASSNPQTPAHHRLLRMQPVFRLVEHHRVRAVHHGAGHLVIPVRRQAMHEQRIGLGMGHQPVVHLIG